MTLRASGGLVEQDAHRMSLPLPGRRTLAPAETDSQCRSARRRQGHRKDAIGAAPDWVVSDGAAEVFVAVSEVILGDSAGPMEWLRVEEARSRS